MHPIKRIIYCIKVIEKSLDKKNPIYNITYHYLVQAVSMDTHVNLDETIYDKIDYPDAAIRYLDIYATDEIDPTDLDYEEYLYLERTNDIHLFHQKKMVTYPLHEVHQ